MRITEGDYFDGKSSHRQAAELRDELGMLSLWTGHTKLVGGTPIADVEISPRIGNTPRYLSFPGGETFECTDNAAIDRLQKTHDDSPQLGLLHRLESHMRYIFISLVLVIAFVGGGILWGIPTLARTAAYSLPASASNLISDGALELLDRQLFTPSELSDEKQAQVQAAFDPIIQGYQDDFKITVLFRHGGKLGANAMALPSGIIIFTDELVELAESDKELIAVLTHEIGHVIKRHGLRQAMQGSILGVLVVTITGDVSSLSSIVTTIPVVLTQLGYSRDFEREADRFALQALQEQGIAPHHFASALQRIEHAARCPAPTAPTAPQGQACEEPTKEHPLEEESMSSYLSTHPPTQDRLKAFLQPSP